ncbi:MAG: porphobilinogen synthase, partial [Opitutales bacterium]|nr:porphobilinogen synthase [Opitutales bacterium]
MNENFKLYISKRPRRLRKSKAILNLCTETRISVQDFILPVFVKEGLSGADEIESMPRIYRHSINSLLKYCQKALEAGISAIAPFPMVDAIDKSIDARESYNPMSLANRAISAVKKNFPEMLIVADIALDPYTVHGHDGILDDSGEWILNDKTVGILADMAVSAAEAGADIVAPSDM